METRLQSEPDGVELDVQRRTELLTELARHLQSAHEAERDRLARRLHDELGALLTSAKLDAARLRSRLSGSGPEAVERLSHLVQTLNSSIALSRSIVEDLRPSALGNLGLAAALEILAREFATRSGLAVHRELAPVKLEPAAELAVYRLVQEALTNAERHARAGEIWLQLERRDGGVDVSVRDDGVGFDSDSTQLSGWGLVQTRVRVEAVGGVMRVASTLGHGTELFATLPEARGANR